MMMQSYSIVGLGLLTTALGAVGLVTASPASELPDGTSDPAAQRIEQSSTGTAPAPTAPQFQVSGAALLRPIATPLPENSVLLPGSGDTLIPTKAQPPSKASSRTTQKTRSARSAPAKVTAIQVNSAAEVGDRLGKSFANMPHAIAQTANPAEVRIISPQSTTTPNKFTDLVVQYPTGAKVTLLVNQTPIGAAIATQAQSDATTNQTTQVWYKVPLKGGENLVTIQAEGAAPVSIKITVKETAAKIEFAPFKEQRVPADGRTALTVEGQVLDETGQPVKKDVVVTLTASAGKFAGADFDKDRPGFQVKSKQGKFKAELRSPLDPQTVRIRAAVDRTELVTPAEKKRPTTLPYPDVNQPPYLIAPNPQDTNLEAYTQAEFITNLRPFILSGQVNLRFGQAGLDYYNSYQDFLRPSLLDQGYRVDFSTAFFASGRVGEWLITGAFNNQRSLNQDCSGATRLFRADQSCDQTYPVYGDSSTVDFLTPSIDSVYFKIERTSHVPSAGSDFAMWGDYTTPEFARASQFYTASTRQLHGFKANYNLGDLQVTMAYANNVKGFQRDTIAPNGTSGYYFLSRRLVIGGSENVFLETQELNRPGTVIERKPLYRGTDYEIDYDRGTLLFRRAINQLEFDPFGRTLVRQIVTTYQFDSDNNNGGRYYAGRVQYNFSREVGRETFAGFTYQREDQGDQRFELYGGDALISLGSDFVVTAEIAKSNFDSVFQGPIDGSAYRFEAFGTIMPGLITRAFYRSVEAGFTNNATASFTPGQTRYGADVSARLSPTTQVAIGFDREVNFGIAPAVRGLTAIANVGFGDLFNPTQEPIPGSKVDNSQTTFKAGVTQKLGPVELGLDYVRRSRQDRIFSGQLELDSSQFISRLNYPITKTLTFRAQDERNLGGASDRDPVYPNRTTVGLDWKIDPDITLRLAQQFVERSSQYNANSFTSFDIISDKRLSDDTTFTSRYSIINGINGVSSQSAMGLTHKILLAPGLRMTLGYERIAGNLYTYTGAGQQFAQPVAVGQSSAALGLSAADSYSVGLDYTDNPNFKANARVEYRNGKDSGDTMTVSASAAGKLSPAFTMLARYQRADYQNQLVTDAGLGDTTNAKLGIAYRNPSDDKFNALLGYEFRKNPGLTPDTILVGTGTGSSIHLISVEGIYAPNWRWEFYGKFALRSTQSYLAKDLLGTNAIALGQARATYKFGYRFDVTGEVRWIGQSVTSYNEVGWAAEVGYYLTPNLRFGLGYSFGRANDRDLDRRKDGVYVTLSLKLDQLLRGFGVQLPDRTVAPPQQQESKVKPVAATPSTPPTAIDPAPSAEPMREAEVSTPNVKGNTP